MRALIRGVLAATMIVWAWIFCAQASLATEVRELPGAPESRSAAGADYVLRSVPFAGQTVTLLDLHAGGHDWTRPDAAKLPALPAASPASMKEPVQWFYGAEAGWMAVPAGWQVQRAAIGADGGTQYVFTAPDGASGGWVSYDVLPVCVGCILADANGLLPNAGEQLAELGSPAFDLGQTNPVISWQSRPDDCTLLFRYRSGGFTVRAAVQSSVAIAATGSAQRGALALAEVYAALPASKSSTADFMVASFRQAFPACRSPNGWPG
ncbi:DUF4850 domain-containing protein [Dyella telluris]|uniref:DUF4850 domain-containing protein n=1 Tax=Dyella telluris TaxID=2763498 RepID=A0A7G8Q903_9GAMM|nr:DUF4850 domain-containing protein [Dyella telluris]QNK03261.1 DUF4850 domain-containing protein [Dyella telluris]